MRTRFAFSTILLFSLLFVAACGSQGTTSSSPSSQKTTSKPVTIAAAAPGQIKRDYTESMADGGLTRTYYIHLPQSYDKQHMVPLVLAFHGSSSTGKNLAQQTHLNTIADTGGFIAVYPDGYQQQWADGRGTTPPEQAGVNDVEFVSDLIDKLVGELAIDKSRVYVTGMSNGGIFSERLGCELASKITAIASVSGTMAAKTAQQCQPARSIPFMLFMGTNDNSVPFGGGEVDGNQGVDLLVAETIQQWVANDECSTTPTITPAPSATNDGTSVSLMHYSSCKDNTDVMLYTIDGGVHTWPGSADTNQSSAQSDRLDAGQVMWQFFQQYHL